MERWTFEWARKPEKNLWCLQEWVDVKAGRWKFVQGVNLDKCNGAAYVVMVNIYAIAGMPEKVKDIEATRIRSKACKLPGCSSWIDSNNKVHHMCMWAGTTTVGTIAYSYISFILKRKSMRRW